MISSNNYNASNPPLAMKFLYFHWPLLAAVVALVCIGALMQYSIAGGDASIWASDHVKRFLLGAVGMFIIAMTPPDIWRLSGLFVYVVVIFLLIATLYFGITVNGATRWFGVAGMRVQPSEFAKVALVMLLASYYHFLPPERVSHPLFLIPPVLAILVPAGLIMMQPDLGTTIFILVLGTIMLFVAGVSLWYFGFAVLGAAGLVTLAFLSRGKGWQLLSDYQFDRIDVFLDPSLDAAGRGWQILQSKIALGSGGRFGRGYMQDTQSRLDFLPESHTDFIFTAYAESFGFAGSIVLLGVFAFITASIALSARRNRDIFGALVTLGAGAIFFLFYMVNISMVMGIAPVVGLSLPFVSYGGSTMLILCAAIGLVQNAHIHRPRSPY